MCPVSDFRCHMSLVTWHFFYKVVKLLCLSVINGGLSQLIYFTMHQSKFLAWPLENLWKKNYFLKKYDRKADSKLKSYIDFLRFLTTTEKNQPKQVRSLYLATFRVLCPPKQISTAYFNFEGSFNFLISQHFKLKFLNWLRGIQCHCYIHLINLTKRFVNHIEF